MLSMTKTNRAIVLSVMIGLLLGCNGAWALETQDLVPQGLVGIPNLSSQGAKLMPPSFTVKVLDSDPDAPDGGAVSYRYLIKSAVTPGGEIINSRYSYTLYWAEILTLDDPEWSPWIDIPAAPAEAEIEIVDFPTGEFFLISVQVLDRDGATSNPFGYQIGTAHVQILANFFRPVVTLVEPFLGAAPASETASEIAGGQPLNFSWIANADAYGGTIVSYRHGWDLVSVDDPNDPGWAVPPGLASYNLFAQERAFQDGVHSFTVRVEDDAGQVRVMNWTLRVVPFISREFQREIMVLDQVVDSYVQNWPDQSGFPRNDEAFRNPWWHFLADGYGGVAGINWEQDWRDHTSEVSFSDVVAYKVVLCYAQFNDMAQRMFQQFRPINDVDQFVWLTPYVQRGGNLFLVGGSSTESFLEGKANYMVPMIFDTREETLIVNGVEYEVGFGTKEMPDGTVVQRGPRMYPYATAGIAALDWTSPNTKTIYNRPVIARFDRDVDCVGLKGLVLTEDFQSQHLIGPGVVADTMWTDPVIDWHDPVDASVGAMQLFSNTFPFRNDEFVDANISARTTPIIPQECDDAPYGMCVEPMYTGISRFDFIREYRWANGETDWPASRYTNYELDDGCGPLALTSYQGLERNSARTNGKTFGYFSYKSWQDKPVRKADVYWGFDPYRFDHVESRKAIRWVLQYMGLQINQ